MNALKLLKNSRKRKRAILRFYKINQFFLLLKNNSNAREFIVKKADEAGIKFCVDADLNDEFFSGLSDLFKLECLGCVVFNHSFFQFVHQTHSIPYRLNIEQKDKRSDTTGDDSSNTEARFNKLLFSQANSIIEKYFPDAVNDFYLKLRQMMDDAIEIKSNTAGKQINIDWEGKYKKCIDVIKRFDAGIIGMYDL